MHHNNNETIVIKIKKCQQQLILFLTKMFQYIWIIIHVLKVAFLKSGLTSFIPLNNCTAVFVPSGILNELLNKFSYPGLGRPMEFILQDPSCCSSHTPGDFLTPWYPALKMTAPLDHQFSKKFLLEYIKVKKTLHLLYFMIAFTLH